MTPDHETLLFARFQRDGDAQALGELYDKTAAKLLRIAFHLVREPPRAEDLVQATFLAAMERAPHFDAARPVWPWLLGILSNQARKQRRDDARRPGPGLAERERSADAAVLASANEFTEQVDAAIAQLPETYQPVLMLHLRHGMCAAEIAHALRRPPGTVRTQIVRGLEQMRELLPASVALAVLATFTPTRGLAAVKQVLLARAAGAAGAGAGAAGARQVWKLLLAAVPFVAIAAASFSWVARRSSADSAGALASAASAPSAPESSGAVPETRATLERVPWQESRPATGSLRVRVFWGSDDQPAAGVPLEVMELARPNPASALRSVTTDPEGRARIDGLLPGRASVCPGARQGTWADVVAGEMCDLALVIRAGVQVTGTVVDVKGAPVPGASVLGGSSREATSILATSDREGHFALRDLAPATGLAAVADGYGCSETWWLVRRDPGPEAVTLVLPADHGELSGLVRGRDGKPIPGAAVRIVIAKEARGQQRAVPLPLRLRSDERGRFRTPHVPLGVVAVETRAPGFAFGQGEIEVAADRVAEVVLELERGAAVRGRVLDERGLPIARAAVVSGDSRLGFARCATTSTDDGAFLLADLPGGEVTLRASKDRLEARAALELAPGMVVGADLRIALGPEGEQIRGRVVDEHGAALEGWRVAAWAGRDRFDRRFDSTLSARDGSFVLPRVPEPKVNLGVYPPGSNVCVHDMVDVERGGSQVTVRVERRSAGLGTMRGRVVDAAGRGDRHAHVTWKNATDGIAFVLSQAEDGSFVATGLPPGSYELQVRASSTDFRPPLLRRELELAAGQDLDVGILLTASEAGGAIVARVRGKGGTVPAGVSGRVRGTAGARRPVMSGDSQDAMLRLEPLAAGSYLLEVWASGLVGEQREVEVKNGERTELAIVLAEGTECTFVLENAPADRELMLHVAWPDGRRFSRNSMRWGGNATLPARDTLVPGEYELMVSAPGRLLGRFPFRVKEQARQEVRIKLP